MLKFAQLKKKKKPNDKRAKIPKHKLCYLCSLSMVWSPVLGTSCLTIYLMLFGKWEEYWLAYAA